MLRLTKVDYLSIIAEELFLFGRYSMRVKRKKHGAERLEACSELLISDILSCKGDPKAFFENDNPVAIEIGCGKGDFIVGMATKNPNINYIAVEKISDVMVTAAEKVKASGLKNIKLCCCDAALLTEAFAQGSLDSVYLNFSDPWPKAKHYKRRLTYRDFLLVYKRLLKNGGAVFFKTDNRGLFDFSLEEFKAAGYELFELTYDLHSSEYAVDNVMTEYERRFSSMGVPINRVVARSKK